METTPNTLPRSKCQWKKKKRNRDSKSVGEHKNVPEQVRVGQIPVVLNENKNKDEGMTDSVQEQTVIG